MLKKIYVLAGIVGVIIVSSFGVLHFMLSEYREWKQPAEAGNPLAQVKFGDVFRYGRGVRRNDEAAAFWYREAAKQGAIDAIIKLGLLYSDFSQQEHALTGLMWFEIAIANGFEAMADTRDRRVPNASADTLSEVQRLAHICMSTGYKVCGPNELRDMGLTDIDRSGHFWITNEETDRFNANKYSCNVQSRNQFHKMSAVKGARDKKIRLLVEYPGISNAIEQKLARIESNCLDAGGRSHNCRIKASSVRVEVSVDGVPMLTDRMHFFRSHPSNFIPIDLTEYVSRGLNNILIYFRVSFDKDSFVWAASDIDTNHYVGSEIMRGAFEAHNVQHAVALVYNCEKRSENSLKNPSLLGSIGSP